MEPKCELLRSFADAARAFEANCLSSRAKRFFPCSRVPGTGERTVHPPVTRLDKEGLDGLGPNTVFTQRRTLVTTMLVSALNDPLDVDVDVIDIHRPKDLRSHQPKPFSCGTVSGV